MLLTKRPLRSRVKRPSYVECRLSKHSIQRKSKSSNLILGSPKSISPKRFPSKDFTQNVTKQLTYHWQTIQKSSSNNSQRSLDGAGKLFVKLKSTMNYEKTQRRDSESSDLCSIEKKSSRGPILDQVEALNKPRDGIKRLMINRFTRKASLITEDLEATLTKSVSDYDYRNEFTPKNLRNVGPLGSGQ